MPIFADDLRNDDMRVRSRHFELRTLRPGEGVSDQVRWLNDPEVARFINGRRRRHDVKSVISYVASHDEEETFLLGIFDIVDGTYIGNHRIVRDRHNYTCALGALVGDRRYWGQGVLTETRAAVLDLVFTFLNAHKAWATVIARNVAVVASYQNLGFRCEGILREHRLVDGRYLDVIQFGMVRDEWIERRESQGAGGLRSGPADRGGDGRDT